VLNYNKQNLRRRFGWLGGDEVYVNAAKIKENSKKTWMDGIIVAITDK